MTLDNTVKLDLSAYLRRIGYSGDLQPTSTVLDALHLAHATHIPYENLDVILKRPIRLDLESLQAKLVHVGRGGYCYEQNGLFAAVLRKVGFSVTPLAARVRYRSTQTLPRTHMILLVQAGGKSFLADVGFGSAGLILPVPFDIGFEARQFAWSYRIVAEGSLWLLQMLQDVSWLDLYTFSLDPQEQADYEMANYYVSTHPASRFVHTLTVQKITQNERHTLRDREYSVDRGASVTTRQLNGDDDLAALLTQTFGLRLPEGFDLSKKGAPTFPLEPIALADR
jgi:N-hydroxyarylamine O-acetyltransferase